MRRVAAKKMVCLRIQKGVWCCEGGMMRYGMAMVWYGPEWYLKGLGAQEYRKVCGAVKMV